jgi:alpha-glucosidase
MQHTGERPLDPLTLLVALDKQGHAEGRLYEDDGTTLAYTRAESRTTRFIAHREAAGIRLDAVTEHGGFDPGPRRVEPVVL